MALLTVEIGAMADPLSTQLGSLIKSKKTLKHLDLLMKSVNVCAVHGLISPGVTEKARDKLMQKIKQEIQKEKA